MLRLFPLIFLFSIAAHAADPLPDALPNTTTNTSPNTSKAKPITLTTPHGTSFDAYIAGPPEATQAVVLMHDRFGLNEQTLEWADRFAKAGYRVLVPDLHDGQSSGDLKIANATVSYVDPEWTKANVKTALSYLARETRKVALIGFGEGASQSLLIATQHPSVAATVMFDGENVVIPKLLRSLNGPVLIVVASNNTAVASNELELERLMLQNRNEKSLVLHKVTANYGFMDRNYGTTDKDAIETAWAKMEQFLQETLR